MSRLAKIAAAFTVLAGAAQAAPVSDAEFSAIRNVFMQSARDQVEYIKTHNPVAPGTGECYTLSNAVNVSTTYLGHDMTYDLFNVLPMTGGKIQDVDGQDMPLSEHFASLTDFDRKYQDTDIIPGMVAVGCYKNLEDAIADRDMENATRALEAVVRATGRLLPSAAP